MHVEGEQLNYFRVLTMTEFDGVKWSPHHRAPHKRITYVPPEELGDYMRRRISVKNASFLEKLIPCDGPVVDLGGNFFARPLVNLYGDLFCQVMWNTANNTYEYYIPKKRKPEPLYQGMIYWHTNYPPQSKRLHAWVDKIVAGISDPWLQARSLETYLQTNFTYELGGPELNRLNPVDDFVFNQKKGHCERFASALTLMLRMKGIPSRIVVGYVPGVRNLLSGGYNIRYSDAHAWTEAYFRTRGWVQMDATPRSTMGDIFGWRTLLDDIDLAWTMYVVNYDAPTQSQLFSSITSTIAIAVYYLEMASVWILVIAIGTGLFLFLRKKNPGTAKKSKRRLTPAETSILANHCYETMMAMLMKRGFCRNLSQTPMEFLTVTAPHVGVIQDSVAYVTQLFCHVRYGTYSMSENEQNKLKNELQRIREWANTRTRS
jgi:transglutaminase-like putative cysteine protease